MARVEIYTKFFCPYCTRAKRLLEARGADYEEYDITLGGSRRQEMLSRAPGHFTVPQIFINDRHIGGSDEIAALDQRGELAPLLAA